MNRPTQQVYENYTPHDFAVWETLFNRQMPLLKDTASNEYLEAHKTIKFSPNRIPDFREVNTIVGNLTGWNLHVVPCISPQKDFFQLLSQKKFTATCWLRTMEQLDYLEEPDMFHDVFGHVPLLTNTSYCDFFKGISTIALEHIENPLAVELLGKIYWFTIEFGLIRENGKKKIYGAGIMSSFGEVKHCLSDKVTHADFDVEKIFSTSYRNDQMQNLYYVIDSYEQLYNSLDEINTGLKKRIKASQPIGI
ncbi:MAG TPA: phenylalanine 4-monooxygenase [Bacteroidia bacterium]|jgi:phenylalanine-4-hydroxylase|nr:phenylalanine 4-monooxygenase [Bacteroidia bacterium]